MVDKATHSDESGAMTDVVIAEELRKSFAVKGRTVAAVQGLDLCVHAARCSAFWARTVRACDASRRRCGGGSATWVRSVVLTCRRLGGRTSCCRVGSTAPAALTRLAARPS